MPGATTKYGLPTMLGADVGSTIDATNQAQMLAVEALVDLIIPPGTILATGRGTAPTGWALCDGASVLRAGTFAALFAAIGTTYGTVDGTHFTLPDLRGRVPVGVDGAAARLTANDALGNSGGEEKHKLTTAEVGAQPTVRGTGAVSAMTPNNTTDFDAGVTAHNIMQPYQVVNWMIKI